ncbi:MAG: DNA-binding response regulator [Cellvibrionaceae bacterium]|nr:DNA-binding response regulator [Cellvibrionaceae bacterium]
MTNAPHRILILATEQLSELGRYIQSFFNAEVVSNFDQAQRCFAEQDLKVLVFDCICQGSLDLELCKALLADPAIEEKPVIVLSKAQDIKDKLAAYEIGCDDFIDSFVSGDEACARVTKSIFHRIATYQLASRLEIAKQTARSAMIDASDLGANIQFLLAVHNCDNLDQLGQQFFSSIERYGLSCSLQIRSIMGVKNMEAHGMAKDLESQILAQFCESGRYIDFGARTICNYDKVSLLIKNMPLDDGEKYGMVKDNTFSLLQGVNARVVALEDQFRLLEEKESLKRLSRDVSGAVNNIKSSYQKVMRDIVSEVEQCSELLVRHLPSLALTEKDEVYLEDIADRVIRKTNATFSEGLVLDESLQSLQCSVERALESMAASAKKSAYDATETKTKTIELF